MPNTTMTPMTPMKAIRAKCLDCCGQYKEVELCLCADCSLHPNIRKSGSETGRVRQEQGGLAAPTCNYIPQALDGEKEA